MKQFVRVAPSKNVYQVIEEPYPHILIESKKELHGWYPGKRECSAERMLINPYNGCSNNCFCCYANALPGYFQLFRKKKIVTVAKDFDRVVARQLDSISVASCGYLSPVTEPFQKVNDVYKLSEKIINVFIDRNIPIEFITKSKVKDEVIDYLKSQRHSFCQFSFFTHKEELRQALMDDGATVDELFSQIEKFAKNGIFVVARVDPIIPYLTDSKESLKLIVKRAIDSGASHIVASCMDIPLKIYDDIINHLKPFSSGLVYDIKKLYKERFGNYLHAKIDYRKKIFDFLRNLCDKLNISFALCMEYELVDGKVVGLNSEFMSSKNCEGINIPIYVRKGNKFEPACDCNGACLYCKDAKCGIEDLAMGKSEATKKAFTLSDYRRWSKNR